MRERSIIHINAADFAVAVERWANSMLRDRPVIIAHEGAGRGLVYDMSDESYQAGVRKGMTLTGALRRCRDAVVLPPRPDRYERAMARLLRHALPYSPLIEVTDYKGHLFIDATGTGRLFGPPADVAWRIRRAVRADMGFDPIWSVASNKLVAKVATRTVKPAGEYIVRAGDERDFLKPLPIHMIPGIEGEDLKRLREFNMTRAGHVAGLSMGQLGVMFGKRSQTLHDAVHGVDRSPVYPIGQQQLRVTVGHEFAHDSNEAAVLEGALYQLIERAGADLRKRGLTAGRVKIVLDYSDGGRIVRNASLNPATANDDFLFAAVKPVFVRAWTRRVRIRHLGLTCDRLTFPPAQLELFAEYKEEETKSDALLAALDKIRFRFGASAVRVGRVFSAPAGDA